MTEVTDLQKRCETLRAALERAAFTANHLFQMIDQETWRSMGGDDQQGHYEGDYWAANVEEQIKEWKELAADV